MDSAWYSAVLVVYAVVGAATLLATSRMPAPYGRHLPDPGAFGPTLPARIGWILMELPAPLCFSLSFLLGDHAGEATPRLLLALWLVHYLPRTLVYPLLLRYPKAPMPLVIVALGAAFNLFNGGLNGWSVAHVLDYPPAALFAVPLHAGVALFLVGFGINQHADAVLRALRKPGETGYKIPYGGLYAWVSCPNYLGELLTWLGFALAAWSPAGLLFALYTFANLGPRALSHHRWYQQRFPDYPPERRALIPGLW